MTKATIQERGNGFPEVGAYVPGDDGNLYQVTSMSSHIHTGASGSGSANFCCATVELADWSDCDEDDEFPAQCVVDEEDDDS